MSGGSVSAVFYAEKYHPIQAGSIDGTDVAPHDNAVLRAVLCSSAGLYDPFGDPKANGDPYCTLFVGCLSRQTDNETLRKAMSRYGRVKSMRLVRDIVTGASRGYAFVEYETDREMRRAYEVSAICFEFPHPCFELCPESVISKTKLLHTAFGLKDAHHSIVDGSEVIVDYCRQQLMPGWIPRRLGGGLGGKKESGQLRFGGRERPFRAPLRPIPYDELKKLGIPPPPVGRYMTRFQVPPPPRRKRDNIDREDPPPRRRSKDRADSSYRRQSSPTEDDGSPHRRKSSRHDRREESQMRIRSSTSREASSYSRQRSPTEDDDDDGRKRKRRRNQEPGEISPDREDGSCERGRTSTEAGYSPRRSHQQRHHRERPHDSSGRSPHRDRRHHGYRAHSRRSESRDYSH